MAIGFLAFDVMLSNKSSFQNSKGKPGRRTQTIARCTMIRPGIKSEIHCSMASSWPVTNHGPPFKTFSASSVSKRTRWWSSAKPNAFRSAWKFLLSLNSLATQSMRIYWPRLRTRTYHRSLHLHDSSIFPFDSLRTLVNLPLEIIYSVHCGCLGNPWVTRARDLSPSTSDKDRSPSLDPFLLSAIVTQCPACVRKKTQRDDFQCKGTITPRRTETAFKSYGGLNRERRQKKVNLTWTRFKWSWAAQAN